MKRKEVKSRDRVCPAVNDADVRFDYEKEARACFVR